MPLELIDNPVELIGGKRIARVNDARTARVCGLHHGAGGVVGTADADDHEGVGNLTDVRGELLGTVENLGPRPLVHVKPALGVGVALLARLTAREHVSVRGGVGIQLVG